MGESIRIEINCINTGLNISLAVGLKGLSMWLACLMTYRMLADSMQGKQTDLPVMRLYEFIRAKTGKYF